MTITNVHIYYPSDVTPGTGDLVSQETTAYDLRKVVGWADLDTIASTDRIKVRLEAYNESTLTWPKDEFETAKTLSLTAILGNG